MRILLVILFIGFCCPGSGQVPTRQGVPIQQGVGNLLGGSGPLSTGGVPNGYGTPAPFPLRTIPRGGTTGSAGTSGTSGTGGTTGTAGTAAPTGGSGRTGSGTPIFVPGIGASDVVPYNPAMDNHLIAPGRPIGLFGKPIVEVERKLRELGAKPYSYAFGKYSKMTFSVYVLTLSFDRKRKLGALKVEPQSPFSRIEPKIQKFLSSIFLDGADLGSFDTYYSNTGMEINYAGEP